MFRTKSLLGQIKPLITEISYFFTGERRTADFPPNTSLFDLLQSLAPNEVQALPQPTIMYMRQEVIGVHALKAKTLRQLGLIGGRAVLRLLNKVAEGK